MSFKNPARIGDNYEKWVFALKQAKKILDESGIKYWIDMGTILGAMRNGQMIPWDNDIDFSVEITEAPKVFKLIPKFKELGYQVVVTDSEVYFNTEDHLSLGIAFYRVTPDKFWIIWYTDYGKFKFITRHFTRVADRILYAEHQHKLHPLEQNFYAMLPKSFRWVIRNILLKKAFWLGLRFYAMVFPRTMLETLGKIELCGEMFPVPAPVEEYVKMIFGDGWRKPDKKWHWDQVLAIDKNFFTQSDIMHYHLMDHLHGNKDS